MSLVSRLGSVQKPPLFSEAAILKHAR